MKPSPVLSAAQKSLAPIAAFTAMGDIERLGTALEAGFDDGLTISDCKEVLVQLYAYAGFPRSLNALSTCMQVLDARRQRGLIDPPGRDPAPVPSGPALLAVGTANQTRLSGAPVKGAVFEFAPAIDQFLKTHLFGDIFGRDNLDWQSRELATVAALAALPGVAAQLQAHVRISMNVGLSGDQLRAFARTLGQRVDPQTEARALQALDAVQAATAS